MFSAVDFSGDNKISLDEYLTAMGEVPPEQHKSVSFLTRTPRTTCYSFSRASMDVARGGGAGKTSLCVPVKNVQ